MGQERTCTLRYGKLCSQGRALLETSEIIFRPADGAPRVKIPFSAMRSVKAVNGELRAETADGIAVFAIGAVAERWREKIRHPKTRAEKLGVRAGMNVSLVGEFDGEFLKELREATKEISDGKVDPCSAMIFLSADSHKELPSGLRKAAKAIRGAAGLWIVYPKGKKGITENEVLTAGRQAGLKDVKVVGFSATHTALKFVIPVAKR
jgi:hypothetical protein